MNTRSAVDPLLTFADNRALREKVWRAFVNRGDNGNANDTNADHRQIVKLRADRAKLLGFSSHAEWRMQDTMAKTPAKAMDLMMRVWPAAVARVKEEVADQLAIARKDGVRTIEPWDYRYYQEKVRKQRYDLSQEEIKPYFSLNNIIEGSYWAAGELYGLRLQGDHRHRSGLAPGHPRLFGDQARDGRADRPVLPRRLCPRGQAVGRLARPPIAVRTGLLGDKIVLDSNNNNFVKPGPGEPVLISLDDAETLFHEFGHAIHYLHVDVDYPSFGGAQRDFVEYPSQVNENWLLTPAVLNRFAKHHKTGAADAQGLVDKIQKAQTFNQGFATVEYLAVGDRRHEAAHGPERGRRSRRVREAGAGRDRHAEGDRAAAPAAAVQPPVLVRRLFGRLLFLPVVGNDGRRHLGGVRGEGQRLGQGDGGALRADPAGDRQRDRPDRGLPPVPRPRPGRQRAAQEARLPDQ